MSFQAYLDNIEAKTGKTPKEFISLAEERDEADRLYAALTEDGEQEMPLQEMFWGDYFGALTDRFGVRWMINCSEKKG